MEVAGRQEDFSNVGKHCVGVAFVAEKMAEALQSKNKLSTEESDVIVQRALVHVKTYAEWQVWITQGLCAYIQLLTNPDSKQDPELFVLDLIES